MAFSPICSKVNYLNISLVSPKVSYEFNFEKQMSQKIINYKYLKSANGRKSISNNGLKLGSVYAKRCPVDI